MLGNLPDTLEPELQAVADYWGQLKRELGRVPRLREIDLMALHKVARFIYIADRIEGLDGEVLYRWRYWGTAVRDHTGVEATGKYLHETHLPQAVREAEDSYAHIFATLEPHFWIKWTRTVPVDRTYLPYRRIVFPLLDDTDRPAHILGVFVSEKREVPLTESGRPLREGMTIDVSDTE